MKKEIINLVNSEEGTFRINNIAFLRRWTKSALNENVDKLTIEFDNINNVHFCPAIEITSRDFDGIITECEAAISFCLALAANQLNKNIRNGYINTTKGAAK